jgi:hypothetical protein
MGFLAPKTPEIQKPPKQAPDVKMEDESVQQAGKDTRRRLAAQSGRNRTVTSMRGSSGYKTVTGI